MQHAGFRQSFIPAQETNTSVDAGVSRYQIINEARFVSFEQEYQGVGPPLSRMASSLTRRPKALNRRVINLHDEFSEMQIVQSSSNIW